VARPEPEVAPPEPEPEPVRAEPEPRPEPEPEQQAALEPEPPEPPKPAPPAALPRPQVKPAPPPPEPEPAKAPPKPPPEPAQTKAEPPQPEPPQPEPPKPTPAMAPKTAAEPKQAPPPEQDEFAALLRSVEEMDRRVQGEVRQDGAGRDPQSAGQARSTTGEAALSRGEVDALLRQIGGCWTLPAGIDGIEDMVVRLRIQVRPDRTVQGVTIEDQGRLNRDPTFRAVAESARRAVDRCSPLNLPSDKYALWRDIVMNFYPQYAIGG
jgi:hypothetical protein